MVNVIDMPIKCPVAPLEFCFLADWQLRERGMRDDVELTFVTPLDGAFTKPVASARLGSLLAEQRHPGGGRVRDRPRRRAPHGGCTAGTSASSSSTCSSRSPCTAAPEYVAALGGPRRRARLRAGRPPHAAGARPPRTCSRSATPPTCRPRRPARSRISRARRWSENIQRFLAGEELTGSYDGHANCFIETGFHRALLIDFDYETEPLPGRYPEPHLGPLPLLAESRLNHLAKLAFQPLYWHVLLPGHDIPGVGAEIPLPARTGAPQRMQEEVHDEHRHARRLGGRGGRRGLPARRSSSGTSRSPQEIARESGIEQLTDRHWQVVNFMRNTYLETGSAPSIRSLGKTSGVPIKELYELFPKGPAKLAAKIGGIPKPRGCI